MYLGEVVNYPAHESNVLAWAKAIGRATDGVALKRAKQALQKAQTTAELNAAWASYLATYNLKGIVLPRAPVTALAAKVPTLSATAAPKLTNAPSVTAPKPAAVTTPNKALSLVTTGQTTSTPTQVKTMTATASSSSGVKAPFNWKPVLYLGGAVGLLALVLRMRKR